MVWFFCGEDREVDGYTTRWVSLFLFFFFFVSFFLFLFLWFLSFCFFWPILIGAILYDHQFSRSYRVID